MKTSNAQQCWTVASKTNWRDEEIKGSFVNSAPPNTNWYQTVLDIFMGLDGEGRGETSRRKWHRPIIAQEHAHPHVHSLEWGMRWGVGRRRC